MKNMDFLPPCALNLVFECETYVDFACADGKRRRFWIMQASPTTFFTMHVSMECVVVITKTCIFKDFYLPVCV